MTRPAHDQPREPSKEAMRIAERFSIGLQNIKDCAMEIDALAATIKEKDESVEDENDLDRLGEAFVTIPGEIRLFMTPEIQAELTSLRKRCEAAERFIYGISGLDPSDTSPSELRGYVNNAKKLLAATKEAADAH